MHWDFFVSFYGLIAYIFSVVNNISLSVWFTFYYSFCLLKGILVASKFCLLWIKLLEIFACSFLCEHSFQLFAQRSKLLSKMIVSFCIQTSSKWEFLLFPCWSAFGSASISHSGHSSRYVVVSPCFNWQFLIWYWVSFNMLIWYL